MGCSDSNIASGTCALNRSRDDPSYVSAYSFDFFETTSRVVVCDHDLKLVSRQSLFLEKGQAVAKSVGIIVVRYDDRDERRTMSACREIRTSAFCGNPLLSFRQRYARHGQEGVTASHFPKLRSWRSGNKSFGGPL